MGEDATSLSASASLSGSNSDSEASGSASLSASTTAASFSLALPLACTAQLGMMKRIVKKDSAATFTDAPPTQADMQESGILVKLLSLLPLINCQRACSAPHT